MSEEVTENLEEFKIAYFCPYRAIFGKYLWYCTYYDKQIAELSMCRTCKTRQRVCNIKKKEADHN